MRMELKQQKLTIVIQMICNLNNLSEKFRIDIILFHLIFFVDTLYSTTKINWIQYTQMRNIYPIRLWKYG